MMDGNNMSCECNCKLIESIKLWQPKEGDVIFIKIKDSIMDDRDLLYIEKSMKESLKYLGNEVQVILVTGDIDIEVMRKERNEMSGL